MAVKELKDGRWAVYYQLGGRKKWEYFGRGELARVKAAKRDEQIRAERGKVEPSLSISVAQLLDEYHSKHFVEDSTADSDFYRIDRILKPSLGRYPAEILGTDKLDEYVKARLDAGRSPDTVRRELGILKSAYSWGESRQPPLVLRNPLARYRIGAAKRSTPQVSINPISMEDFRRLLRHAREHLVRAMYLQWYGGQRPGREVLGIRWGDVDFERGEMLVHSAHKGASRQRYVPIHADLLPLMRKWLEGDAAAVSVAGGDVQGVTVVNYNLRPVRSIKTTWKNTKQRAGITRKLRLYDFRHAWFTNALRHGADLKSTSEVGGHSRADTTMVFYQHTVREQHHQVVGKIPRVADPRRQTS